MDREKQIPHQNLVNDQWILIDPDRSHPEENLVREQQISPWRKLWVRDEIVRWSQEAWPWPLVYLWGHILKVVPPKTNLIVLWPVGFAAGKKSGVLSIPLLTYLWFCMEYFPQLFVNYIFETSFGQFRPPTSFSTTSFVSLSLILFLGGSH